MAQSIEDFAAPLLARAKKSNKKIKKDIRNQNYALLGVSLANQALRARAMNRAQSWFTGAEPILQQAKDQAQSGFNFWSQHNAMLKDHDPSDWRTAKAKQLFDTDLVESSVPLSSSEKQRQFADYKLTIKDQLDAYKERMDLHAQFKGATTEKDKERLRNRYYGTVEKLIDNEVIRLKNDNNIFSAVTGALGISGKDRLDDIDLRTGIPASGLSPKEQEVANFFKNVQLRKQKDLGLTETVAKREAYNFTNYIAPKEYDKVYGLFNVKANEWKEWIANDEIGQLQTDLDVYGGAPIELRDTRSGEELTLDFHELIDLLPKQGATRGSDSPRIELVDDVMTLSSILKYKHQAITTKSAQVTGRTGGFKIPDDSDFFKAAIEMISNDNRFLYSDDKVIYDKYDDLTLTQIANDINSLLSDDQSQKIYADENPNSGPQDLLKESQRALEEKQAEGTLVGHSFNGIISALNKKVKDENYDDAAAIQAMRIRKLYIQDRERIGDPLSEEEMETLLNIDLSLPIKMPSSKLKGWGITDSPGIARTTKVRR
tara:strand:+ start:4709 stop:6340 length:1632 start_codon:yes stop_codon:yes gene_type:complete